jgi:tocopherol O-methyltransferase
MTKQTAFRQEVNAFQDIIDYYDQTRFDYQVAWLNAENLAVHFGFYDRQHQRHEQALVNTNKVMARESQIQAGEAVLDAGCGKGGSAIWLAKNAGAEVIGISPVATQIEEAREHANRVGVHGQVMFELADFCNTPFEDACFDVVWACESLCHASDKQAFYEEAYRILKPGGRLIIAEYVRRQRPLTKAGERLLLGWLNRWAIPDIDTAEEHRQHAQSAGFTCFDVQDYTPYTWISLKNLHKIARRWLWANYVLYFLRIRRRHQHNNIVGSILQYSALKQDFWFYALIKAQKDKSTPYEDT